MTASRLSAGALTYPPGQLWRIQDFTDALLQRGQIIGDAPREFASTRAQLQAADQARNALVTDTNRSASDFRYCLVDLGSLLRRQLEGAAHQSGIGRSLDGRSELLSFLGVQRPKPNHEHAPHALFQTYARQIRQRLARDRKHLVAGSAHDLAAQRLAFVA